MPKVSVLLPAYNHEQYIAATLDSLLSQSEPDIEILAVDDGSRDRTGVILDDYQRRDSRVKAFHKENGGVVSALNAALDHASGEWIASCGSDDLVPKNAYRRFLEKGKNADVVIGEFREITDAGSSIRVRLNPGGGKSCFGALFAMPAMWNKLIRSSLIRRRHLRFREVPLCEDLIFLAELAALRPRCSLTRRVVYLYRNNPAGDSMTHSYTAGLFRAHTAGREAVLEICREAGLAEGTSYVYQRSLPYLADFLQRLPADSFGSAFEEAKRFFSGGREYLDGRQFERLFLLAPDQFLDCPCGVYQALLKNTPHEEYVLRGFLAGEIGLQLVIKYAAAWAAGKFRSH